MFGLSINSQLDSPPSSPDWIGTSSWRAREETFVARCTAIYPLFANSPAQGQAEIDPDHYETTDSQSRPAENAAKTKAVRIHYEGNFTLPHSVHCEGKSHRPGDYLVSVDSDGSTVRMILNRRYQDVRIEGVPETQPRYRGRDALLVERSWQEP